MSSKFLVVPIFLSVIFYSVTALAESTPPGISFEGHEFNSDHHIEFTIHESFPSSVSLSEVKSVFTNPNIKVNFSDYLVEAIQIRQNDGKGTYQIVSTGTVKKFGFKITKKIAALCVDTETATTYTQSCSADISYGSTGMLLKKSKATVNCSMNSEARVECEIKSSVYPKGVNYLVFKRTDEELCFSGTSESFKVMGHLYEYIIHGKNVEAAKQAYEFDKLPALNRILDKLWDTSRDGDLEGKDVLLHGDTRGGFTNEIR